MFRRASTTRHAPGAWQAVGWARTTCKGKTAGFTQRREELLASSAGPVMANYGRNGTHSRLEEILDRRIMVLDGSMGALIYSYNLTEEDVRGSRFARHPVGLKNCTEALVLTRPKL